MRRPVTALCGRMEEMVTVTCQFCWQSFEIPLPAEAERPCELDYDCEICCKPLTINIDSDGSGRVLEP